MRRLPTSGPSSWSAERRCRAGIVGALAALLFVAVALRGERTVAGTPLPPPQRPQAAPKSSAADLLAERARSFLARHANLKAGEQVLIISDRSTDPLVRSAFVDGVRAAGATATELVLQGEPETTSGLEIARRMRFKQWYPEWVWKTAENSDAVLVMTSLGGSHVGRDPKLPRTRVVDIPFSRREQLADPMARGHYPDEILAAIARVLWKQVFGAQRVVLTDPEGTDLAWTLDAQAWDEVKDADPASNATHVPLPNPYRARTPDMRGWLVASSTHSGPLPRVRLKIEGGRVVEIRDGGPVAEYLRTLFAASEALRFPNFPAAGSNWVEETTFGTHPRHARVPHAETFGWSAEMSGWVGGPRAGVFHLAVGTSHSGRNLAFAREHRLEVQHLDLELYAPTLVMDGRTIISRGRLAALDDPEVRQIAAKFGDPAELLRVTWLPAVK